jgi:hypothetical protein
MLSVKRFGGGGGGGGENDAQVPIIIYFKSRRTVVLESLSRPTT